MQDPIGYPPRTNTKPAVFFDGARAKRTREDARRSPESVASAVGVSLSTLYHWEAGRRVPSVDEAIVLAGVLGVDLAELLKGT